MERLNFDILDENHDVTVLEIAMLPTQIGGEWSASREKENYWTLLESEFDSGSTSHLFDTRALTAWSQQYRDDKCTKQLYSVWIFPVNCKGIMNRHAHRIDQSTYVLTASWRDSVCGVPSATIVGPANDAYFGIIRNWLNCHWKRCGELGTLIKTYYLRDKLRAKVIIKILKMLGESSTSANRWRQ